MGDSPLHYTYTSTIGDTSFLSYMTEDTKLTPTAEYNISKINAPSGLFPLFLFDNSTRAMRSLKLEQDFERLLKMTNATLFFTLLSCITAHPFATFRLKRFIKT